MDSGEKYGEHEDDRTLVNASGAALPYSDEALKSRVQPGTMLGDYEVLELIGRGGMGYVYKVRHRILEKVYAMKTMTPEQVTETAWRRFQNEAQAIARMSHPNIVGIHNLGMHEGRRPYYVMDILEGQNLADCLDEEGPLTVDTAISIFVEVAKGLEYAHRKGIIHRDIKPGNIVILNRADATGARVKLVDFGIAKLSQASEQANQNLTTVGEIFGSPLYMSPEQCQGQRIDARSDNYSLGCTLFEALTGEPPFKAATPLQTMLAHQSQAAPTLASKSDHAFPQALEEIMAKLLAKEPMNRYQNLDELAHDLLAVNKQESGSSQSSFRVGDSGSDSDSANNNNIKYVILAASLILTVAAACLFMASGNNGRTTTHTPDISTTSSTADISNTSSTASSVKSHAHDLLTEKFCTIRFDKYKRRIKVFDFPTNRSLGVIRIAGDSKENFATGHMEFPADQDLHFIANPTMMSEPRNFELIGDGDFCGIYLNDQAEGEIPASSNSAIPIAPPVDADIKATLSHMSHLKSLRELRLRNCLQLTDEEVRMFDQFPKLEQIDFTDCNVDCRTVAKLKRIAKFIEVNVTSGSHASTVIAAVAGSPYLVWLTLNATKEPLTLADVNNIASCKNLKQLDAEHTGLTNASIKILAHLPILHVLYAGGNQIDCQAIPDIVKMKALTRVRLTGKNWGSECSRRLKEVAPKITDAEMDTRHQRLFTF